MTTSFLHINQNVKSSNFFTDVHAPGFAQLNNSNSDTVNHKAVVNTAYTKKHIQHHKRHAHTAYLYHARSIHELRVFRNYCQSQNLLNFKIKSNLATECAKVLIKVLTDRKETTSITLMNLK